VAFGPNDALFNKDCDGFIHLRDKSSGTWKQIGNEKALHFSASNDALWMRTMTAPHRAMQWNVKTQQWQEK